MGYPTPHPPFGHLLPQGEKGLATIVQEYPFSPCGRRWREAPDEGSGRASYPRRSSIAMPASW